MKVVLQDFTYAGKAFKVGDKVSFGMIEADDLYRFILNGQVKDDKPAAVKPAVEPTKGRTSKPVTSE